MLCMLCSVTPLSDSFLQTPSQLILHLSHGSIVLHLSQGCHTAPVSTKPGNGAGVYRPPAARKADTGASALQRRVIGLLNRLADSNLRLLASELADLAQSAGQQDVLPLVSAGLLQVGHHCQLGNDLLGGLQKTPACPR